MVTLEFEFPVVDGGGGPDGIALVVVPADFNIHGVVDAAHVQAIREQTLGAVVFRDLRGLQLQVLFDLVGVLGHQQGLIH